MRVTCRNVLCKGKPFEAMYSGDINELNDVQCPHCGHVGAMPEFHVVNSDELLKQMVSWKKKVLYKEAFKAINYKKLPSNMEQQMVTVQKPKPVWSGQPGQKKLILYKKKYGKTRGE